MTETVFILGAGASAHAGAPLMWDFLDHAERLYHSDSLDRDSRQAFALVFKGIAELHGVFAKSSLDIENLESVFAAFELAAILGKLGGLARPDIDRLSSAMRTVIVETLTHLTHFPVEGKHRIATAPHGYAAFVRTYFDSSVNGELHDRRRAYLGRTCIITFNYDLALDYALDSANVSHSYCLNDTTDDLALLKLHGSLNWYRESDGGPVHAWTLSDYFESEGWSGRDLKQAYRLPLAKRLRIKTELTDPVIVPPAWSKVQHFGELAQVWSEAARRLSTADNIIVCGYSLPLTDEFFRYLFAIGSANPATRLKRFWVIDPAPAGSELERRFRDLLGPVAESRFKYFTGKFETIRAAVAADGTRLTTLLF